MRAMLWLFWASVLSAQSPLPSPLPTLDQPPPPSQQDAEQRLLGVLPNFLTTEQGAEPLTTKEKFALVARQTYDPVTIMSAAAGAGLSQAPDQDPKYGVGSVAYAKRFGAAMADLSTQNFFGGAVLASVLHEDPRYFREGAQYSFWHRVGYALSRVVITRTDAGTDRFAYSAMAGMAMGIALSNAYYPNASVSGSEVAHRFGTSLLSSAVFNILPEFWPDVHDRLFHRKAAILAATGNP